MSRVLRRRNPGGPHASAEQGDGPITPATGFQPWRKLLHAFTGVVIALALALLPIERPVAITIAFSALVVLFVVDVIRLSSARANQWFYRSFSVLLSSREAGRLASSTWYALGVLIVIAFFSEDRAVSAVLVLGIADPVASYVGRKWGKIPFLGGTAVGSTAFFAVAVTVLGPRHGFASGAVAALATTLAERRSWPVDDNLAIPVVCAGVLAGVARLW